MYRCRARPHTARMPLLFSYGTLQQEPTQRETFGRRLEGRRDELRGYCKLQVPVRDAAVVRAHGLTETDTVAFTGNDGDVVSGTVLEVTDAELARSDAYETPFDYDRVQVTLASGTMAWVYRHESSALAPNQSPVAGDTSTSDVALMRSVLVGAADPEIVELEARIRAAQLAADVNALDALISDDLLFTGPSGQLGTKAQDLDAHGTGIVRFRAHVPRELRVRRVGSDVAVTALLADLAVDVMGTATGGTFRYTRIWARERDGVWRVVGGHVSQVQTEA